MSEPFLPVPGPMDVPRDWIEQIKEERRREYAQGFADGLEDAEADREAGDYDPFRRLGTDFYPRPYWIGKARGYRA